MGINRNRLNRDAKWREQMKRKYMQIACAFLLALMLIGCGNNSDVKVGKSVTGEFSTTTFSGFYESETIFEQKDVTMINIWGSFCGPCIAEMPGLENLHQEYYDKGFQIVGIPLDVTDANGTLRQKQFSDAKLIIEKTKVSYVNLIPTMDLQSTLLKDVNVVPQTVFVNREGKQIGEIYYGAKSEAEWRVIIEKLLKSQEKS